MPQRDPHSCAKRSGRVPPPRVTAAKGAGLPVLLDTLHPAAAACPGQGPLEHGLSPLASRNPIKSRLGSPLLLEPGPQKEHGCAAVNTCLPSPLSLREGPSLWPSVQAEGSGCLSQQPFAREALVVLEKKLSSPHLSPHGSPHRGS